MINSLGDVHVPIKLEVEEESPSSPNEVVNNNHSKIQIKQETSDDANYEYEIPQPPPPPIPLLVNEVVHHREGEVFIIKQEVGSDDEQKPQLEEILVESSPKRPRRSKRITVEVSMRKVYYYLCYSLWEAIVVAA